MSRIVLLAPGDVISQCKQELEERGIKTHIVEWDENTEDNKQEKNIRKGIDEDGQSLSISGGNVRTTNGKPVGSASAMDGLCSSGDKRILDKGMGGDFSGGTGSGRNTGNGTNDVKEADASMSKLLEKTEKETPGEKVRKSGDGKKDEEIGSKQSKEKAIYVMTDDIKDKISEQYDVELKSTTGDATKYDESNNVIIELGSALIKKMGLTNETKNEQSDELKRIRRINRKFSTIKIDSEKGLTDIIGKRKKISGKMVDERKQENNKNIRTRVKLITNDIKYVDQAHVIFTAPTGDINWKQVARKATSRANIRAYAYTPSSDISLIEALTTLVDVV
uniref:VP6 n=1 Tax=Peruvian horse sickness virus TaxID=356862 RepID=A0A7L7Q1N4_9REOV|nr:VP6 [Peruvian horse sickness virus]